MELQQYYNSTGATAFKAAAFQRDANITRVRLVVARIYAGVTHA